MDYSECYLFKGFSDTKELLNKMPKINCFMILCYMIESVKQSQTVWFAVQKY